MHQFKVNAFIPCFILCLALSSVALIAQPDSVLFPFISSSPLDPETGQYIMDASPYAFITDDQGVPVYQRYFPKGIRNFKPLDDTTFAVYSNQLKAFLLLNKQMLTTDTVFMNGPYEVDFHHISKRENGNLILLGKELQIVDLSGTVWAGKADATLSGAVIQEFDQEKNLLFEWKSLDHIGIGDSLTCSVDPQAQSIDYIHVNSVQADTDSTWIISCRNMDQVMKIHKASGKILWRLGGAGNQFTFTNDPLRFSAQHSVYLNSNGDLSLFDNGNCKIEKNSRALIYSLNQKEKTVTLSGELTHTQPVFSLAMGNYSLLPGAQSLAGWGQNSNRIVLTHYQGDAILQEIAIKEEYPYYSYAVHLTKWQSPVEILQKEPLKVGNVKAGDSLLLELEFHNTLEHEVRPAEINFDGAKVAFGDALPLPLAPGETRLMKILCIPEKEGHLESRLTAYFRIGQESLTALAGSQIRLILVVSTPSGKAESLFRSNSIGLFPNPSNQMLSIELREPVDRLGIYDMNGVLKMEFKRREAGSFIVQTSELASGMYFVIGRGVEGKLIKGRFVKLN